MRGLELARPYHPGLKPELLAGGFPELKADGSPFSKDDYMKLHKETRSTATQIADGIELSRLEAGYDSQSKRRKMRFHVPSEFSLLPSPTESSELAGCAEPASSVEGDELKMDGISDVDLVEVCNKLLSPAGVTGSSSQSIASDQA